ncbi:MAG TPA: M20/M25/M40 family metallo-hydrolase [Vicinamibacterales bacterium]|nr:M20/M25/M40 family metallo-hydrolase [Vicinamibacterales bacterium]
MKSRRFMAAAVVACAAALPVAQTTLDPQINDKIRKEEAANSQVMRTLHYLADVYGPRVTGSPNHKAAAEWAVKTMTGWGMQNGKLEPWDFGYPGWLNERLSVHAIAPFKDALVVEALAWTPGTNGRVTANAFNLVVPEGPLANPAPDAPAAGRGGRGPARLGPTEAELTTYLDSIQSKVAGAAVLVGKHTFVPVNLDPPPGRLTDEQVHCRYDEAAANDPACANQGRGRGFGGGGAAGRGQTPGDRLTTAQVNQRVAAFLVANKAAFRVNDAGRAHGQIAAFDNSTRDITKAVPTVVMRNEDYGRIARIVADGTPVQLEAEIVNKWYPEGKTSYNAVAEIPGTDKKDAVVMAGGHLDSWHSATGATDNAIGCAIMMEAARILRALNVQPRRTIRIALWSGEEEGLLGSLAYVKAHFGSAEAPQPEFAKFDGYLNIDTGTGRLRGASVFGPPEAPRILREIFAPFKDLKIAGAIATSSRATGGTDSTSFNNAGLPGIGFSQDSIEYNSHTHHTNLDTYERIIEQDVRDAAVIVAATLYQLAMRDEALPRFAADKMPPKPAGRGGSGF